MPLSMAADFMTMMEKKYSVLKVEAALKWLTKKHSLTLLEMIQSSMSVTMAP